MTRQGFVESRGFPLDDFQLRALDALDAGRSVLVAAPTGSGKTVVAEYAAPLLRVGGTLVAWKGRVDPEELADGAVAAVALGLEVAEVVPVMPYPEARHRHLHVMHKVAPTPPRFPRRPGITVKRPLRAA